MHARRDEHRSTLGDGGDPAARIGQREVQTEGVWTFVQIGHGARPREPPSREVSQRRRESRRAEQPLEARGVAPVVELTTRLDRRDEARRQRLLEVVVAVAEPLPVALREALREAHRGHADGVAREREARVEVWRVGEQSPAVAVAHLARLARGAPVVQRVLPAVAVARAAREREAAAVGVDHPRVRDAPEAREPFPCVARIGAGTNHLARGREPRARGPHRAGGQQREVDGVEGRVTHVTSAAEDTREPRHGGG